MQFSNGILGKFVVFGGIVSIITLLVAAPVEAVPITFNLGQGGSVFYAGGTSPFQTIDGVVESITDGSTTLSIVTGTGKINLATSNYTGFNLATGPSSFITEFSGGGSSFVTILGDLGMGAGIQTLLSGSFLGNSYFNCCTQSGSSTFNGSLTIDSINTELAILMAYNPPPQGGNIAQFEINLNPAPSGPGVTFSGTQGGGQVFVADSPQSVPEPSTLLLLGSALIGLGLLGKRTE